MRINGWLIHVALAIPWVLCAIIVFLLDLSSSTWAAAALSAVAVALLLARGWLLVGVAVVGGLIGVIALGGTSFSISFTGGLTQDQIFLGRTLLTPVAWIALATVPAAAIRGFVEASGRRPASPRPRTP